MIPRSLQFLLFVFLSPTFSFIVPSLKANYASLPLAAATEDSAALVETNSDGPSGIPLFNETIPMLWLSRLVYTFATLVKEARAERLVVSNETFELLNSTEGSDALFPRSFESINDLIKQNWGALKELAEGGNIDNFDFELLEKLRKVENRTEGDSFWLEDFDSLNQKVECVYGVVRDDKNKRIILSFRGSVAEGTSDWARNFQVQKTDMRIPTNLSKIMNERSETKLETVPVHAGFYEYLFNNSETTTGAQKFDAIRDKLQPLLERYPNYNVYVVGHSLGAALSSLIAYKLAGSSKEWIPKPVTCISFESPMNGGVEFRDSFKVLEQQRLIRYLRVTNQEDLVPAIPPWSLRWRIWKQTLYKHVGLQLNLMDGDFQFVYPRDDNGYSRAWSNNFVTKRSWNVELYHGLNLVQDRLDKHVEALISVSIDDVYRNETIVGDLFSGPDRDEL